MLPVYFHFQLYYHISKLFFSYKDDQKWPIWSKFENLSVPTVLIGQIKSKNIVLRSTTWLRIFTWRTLDMIIYVNSISFNPSTGEVNAEFGSTTDSEFQAAIEYAKTAQGNWASTTPMDRSDILRRAADLLDKYREERIPTM